MSFDVFASTDKRVAEEASLRMELSLLDCQDTSEVALLEAMNEEERRKTHVRCFERLYQLMVI